MAEHALAEYNASIGGKLNTIASTLGTIGKRTAHFGTEVAIGIIMLPVAAVGIVGFIVASPFLVVLMGSTIHNTIGRNLCVIS